MNDKILNRLNEINKELNKIEKEEETDMNIEKIVDNELNEFLSDIEEIDFEIFEEYRNTTNNTEAQIEDLFNQLTPQGIMKVINVITKIYVYKLKNNDLDSLTRKELRNLSYFGMNVCIHEPKNEVLKAILMSLILTFSKKGGE